LEDKIEVLGPTIDLSRLKSNIFAEIVNYIGVTWDEMFGRLVNFKQVHGHTNVPHTFGDNKLGWWVATQRVSKRLGQLKADRIDRLDSIGFVWEVQQSFWDKSYAALVKFKEIHGHTDVPQSYHDKRLATWIDNQRIRRDRLPAARRAKLDAIGFIWDARTSRWEDMYQRLVHFKESYGHMNVRETVKKLTTWMREQRSNRAFGALSEDRFEKLSKIGFPWDVRSDNWQTMFNRLVVFRAEHQHANVPDDYQDKELARWVRAQREFKKRGKLSIDRVQSLEEIGFVWDIRDPLWEKGFSHLKAYRDREGHCDVPSKHREKGFYLGRWVNGQRRRKSGLSEERQKRLEDLGFVWNTLAAAWEDGFRRLSRYREREGDCRVPQGYQEDGFRLGQWVAVQRQLKAKDKLPLKRQKRLDALGFVWKMR
jgi:hypothetical protein